MPASDPATPSDESNVEVVRKATVTTDAHSTPQRTIDSDRETTTSYRILVVDDNRDAAQSISMVLSLSGHDVQTVFGGTGALEAGERFRPQAVLLDIGMPEMNGYEVCRLMRQESWGKHIAVIALSGYGQDADRQQSSAAGFDGHLVKPADPHAVLALLHTLVKAKRTPPS